MRHKVIDVRHLLSSLTQNFQGTKREKKKKLQNKMGIGTVSFTTKSFKIIEETKRDII